MPDIVKSDEFWFEDGNLVLLVRVTTQKSERAKH